MKDISILFEKSKMLVEEAGNFLLTSKSPKNVDIKSDGTLVTNYDLSADDFLTTGLRSIANCGIYSEEHEEKISSTYFIIDPIDGTHNFNAGLNEFGIMLAYVENNEILFSIIYLPKLQKMYHAIKGHGAYMNKTPIHIREDNLKLIGDTAITPSNVEIIKQIEQSSLNIEFRSYYCTAVSTCYVAEGIFDFYFCLDATRPWDVFPPKLIIEEAGGIVKHYEHDGYCDILAGSPLSVNKLMPYFKVFK